MSAFLTDLEVENVNDTSHSGRGLWKVIAPLAYQSDLTNGIPIVVPTGFLTDFASVPRLPVTYLLAGDTAHKAAVIHDFLYSVDGPDLGRDMADAILKEAAITEGVPAWRANLIYAGVRLGGGIFYKRKDDEEVPSDPPSGPLA